jgi:hypothetical protein
MVKKCFKSMPWTAAAMYLNPLPITVARADATRDGSIFKVLVELRAPGYPGSTYTLTYDPTRDQPAGIYFQAALQQRFDVMFVRRNCRASFRRSW